MFRRTLFLTLSLLILSCSRDSSGGVVSLAPSADEIIVAVGGKERLSGVSTYSKVKGVTVVGDLINPDYERILSLRPEVVVLVLPMQNKVKARLEKLGLRTYDFSPESADELVAEIERLGKLVGHAREADRLADSVRRAVESIKPVGKFSFYVELSSKPVFVAGDSAYISDIISRFGGRNLFSDVKGYAPVSTEEIMAKDPDIVFTTQEVGDRIGLKACVVKLKHEHVAPGLSVFDLIGTLKVKIDSCLRSLGKS